MPKGIPNTPKPNEEAPRKMTITLRPEHYAALLQLADEQYRSVELQAAWLLAKVLGDAGRVAAVNGQATAGTTAPVAHAQRIMERAQRNTAVTAPADSNQS